MACATRTAAGRALLAYNRAMERVEVLDSFPAASSPLFRDYLAGRPEATRFYEGPWDLEAVVRAGERAAASGPRAAAARALVRQQELRGNPVAAAQAARLAEPGACAVVTGQQAGLFGGPLYVLYKALGAQRVAREVEARSGRPCVPVFWIASDDHDFAEVRQVTLLDEAGQIRDWRYAPHALPEGRPAAAILLDETVAPLVEEALSSLPMSPYREEVGAALRRAYAPGHSLSGAFALWLGALLPDLVLLDPADPELKRLMAPVMAREIAERSPGSALALEAGERLKAAGYHQQVPVRGGGFLNLFLVDGGARRALALDGDLIEVRGTGRRFSLAEALARLEADPAAWSPGVLLRPLAQDLLLPTAAYVGGPAEIAYHAQIGPSYAHYGVPRPVLLPRPSVTVVEAAQTRALDAEGLGLRDLTGDAEALVTRWAREAYPDVEEAFAAVREAVAREMANVEERLAALDPTLRAAADSARGRALHQIESLHEKATRALKKRDQGRAERLRRTRDALLPGGAPQERGLGLLGLVARHGPGLVDVLRERLDPFARGHQVCWLQGGRP